MSTSSKNKNLDETPKISIGYVCAAHGVKGDIKIVPLTDFLWRFEMMDFLHLYSEGCFVCTLRLVRVKGDLGKGELIVESDLSDRSEAEKLVGAHILIDREARVPLPEGHFWIDDLIGLEVQDGEGNLLGVVENLISAAGNEVYEIEDGRGRRHYIPAVEEFVKDINLASGKITVNLIEGLWE
jgi:16S rRNA processing protein RimM